VAWGDNFYGQTNVPALPPGLTYVQVAAGYRHSVALRSDGSAVAWGDNFYGQTNVPPLPPGLTYVLTAAGGRHTVAIRNDGSAVAWGNNSVGQTNVPPLLPGFTYLQVATSANRSVALVGIGSQARVNPIGLGCLGSNGITTLSSLHLPVLGNAAFSLDVTQAATNSQAYLFLATAPAAIPISIGGGCSIYLDLPNLLAFVNAGISPIGPRSTNVFGGASFPLPVPSDPLIAGVSIFFQAAVLDAPLGLTLSNAVECVLY
jgi:hypothetical protein